MINWDHRLNHALDQLFSVNYVKRWTYGVKHHIFAILIIVAMKEMLLMAEDLFCVADSRSRWAGGCVCPKMASALRAAVTLIVREED